MLLKSMNTFMLCGCALLGILLDFSVAIEKKTLVLHRTTSINLPYCLTVLLLSKTAYC